jgi:hypothetical protein
MFLGNGDTSKLESDEQATLAHLRRMIETNHLIALNPKESEVAVRAITFYSRWESVFALIQSLRNVIVISAGGLGFWWVTGGENFITEFIRRVSQP